jgi:AraC family transcriptional activator of pobA
MSKTKSKPIRYGLYGEEDLYLPDFIHCETMEYRSEKHNWIIEPHLHAHLFQLFLIEAGKVQYQFEENECVVHAGSVITIPENTLHGLQVSKDVKGMVLTLSSSFVETVFQLSPNLLMAIGTTRLLTGLKNHQQFSLIKQMVYGLHEELRDDLPEKAMVLQNYFSLLLCSIYRLVLEKTENTITAGGRNVQYFRAFQRSIKQAYTPQKSINAYARELHMTPVHLNRICQTTVGKSALQVVHDFFFLEAKKYLKHTEYSISEIAYRLNFEDPAYFSRFFSKLAGCSPKQFRERN